MKTYSKDLYAYADLYKKGLISQKMFEDIVKNYLFSSFSNKFHSYFKKNMPLLSEDFLNV